MTRLLRLLAFVSRPRLAANKIRTFLSVIGIGVGVATFIAVVGMNDSIINSFQKSVDELAGKTEIEVTGSQTGFPESVFEKVLALHEVRAVAPIIEGTGIYRDRFGKETRLFVMGIDTLTDEAFRSYRFTGESVDITDPIEFLNSTKSIILTETFAKNQGISLGSEIPLVTPTGTRKMTVRGLMKAAGPAKTFGGAMAIMDVYAAQIAFGRGRVFDRLDIISREGVSVEETLHTIQAAVPEGLWVRRPFQRSSYATKLLRSFRSGLYVGSLVALLTGLFLVYNTVSMAVMERKKEIGTLRALGVSRRSIRLLFAAEALVLGLAGSLLGVPLGLLLAKLLLASVSKSVSEIYLRVNAAGVVIDPATAAAGVLLGLAATLVASIYPAFQASRVTVIETLRHEEFSRSRKPSALRFTSIGTMLLMAALLLSLAKPVRGFPLFGYLSIVCVLVGAAFLAPVLLIIMARVASPFSRQSILMTLSVDGLLRSLSRSGVTVAALMVGLSMMTSISGFLHSMKGAMTDWLDQSVNANLVVTASSRMVGPSSTPLGEALWEKLRGYPGVDDVTEFRMIKIPFRQSVVLLGSINMRGYLPHNKMIVMEGELNLDRLEAGTGILVSDNFSNLYGVHAGDSIPLPCPTGPCSFEVLAVVRDFSSDNGVIFCDRVVTVDRFQDHLVDSFGLYLQEGVREEPLRRRILAEVGSAFNLKVLTNREFRADINRIVDQSFRIADALQILSLLISLCAIVTTLLAEVMDRRRMLGVLRAIGGLRRQVLRYVLYQAGFLGIAGNMAGVLSGYLVGIVLIRVVNRQNTGWAMEMDFPLGTLLPVLAVALLVALASGYYPARRASRLDIVKALEYE